VAVRAAVVALLAGIAVPAQLAAQQVPIVTLKPANGTVSAAFTNVRSMHELSDGRVLLSDAMARLMGLGDFRTGTFAPISGVNVGPIAPLAGDSTVMWGVTQELVFFVGAQPIGMLPRDNPVAHAATWISGADRDGHFLFTRGDPCCNGADSEALVEIERTSAHQDTIGWIDVPQHLPKGSLAQYRMYEAAQLSLDGWVAVLRINPYRVDWRDPAANWTLGAPIPFPQVKLTDREKLFAMARAARGGPPDSPESITAWPDVVPPWSVAGPPMLSSDGRLFVRRIETVDAPERRYDMINRRGTLEGQLIMASNETILGFGTRSIYVTVTAPNGQQSVQRHPWP
jgi:hypothetical protein